MKEFQDNEYAFTLAEVLITLVIIGVIAAITVPTLMNKTNKQEYVSRLKKAYSTMAQATNLIIAENGSPKGEGSWLTDENGVYSGDKIMAMYKKYLHGARECGDQEGCFYNGTYKQLNDQNYGKIDNRGYEYRRLVLSDGTSVMFDRFGSESCNRDWDGVADNCALIWVDLNGARKPNQFGRDLFWFIVKKNGLYPNGCTSPDDTFVNSTCDPATKGAGCACRVLREGAMNY